MLLVKDLIKSYDSLQVLKSISFEVKQGSVFGFLGRNGQGKSTTMNILTGLIGYNSGEIYIDGKAFKEHKPALMKSIGYLTENPVFYGYMTAKEYLRFIGEISDYDKKGLNSRIEKLLDQVKLTEVANRKVGGFSRGMKQRLALAVALLNHPSLLFLDEPTSALDPEGRMEMLDLIDELKGSGITVFLSTHILNDVERVCDNVSILNKGDIILTKSLKDLNEEFIQPIYDIELEEDCTKFSETLKAYSWVDTIQTNGKKLSVYINDMNLARIQLLETLAREKTAVISYQVRKNSLEDIFIRMVNEQ